MLALAIEAFVASSPTSATTIAPLSASFWGWTTMRSPSRMPASTMESPMTRAGRSRAVVAAKEAGHVDELFDVLFRQQRDAGRHLADQRQGARRSELTHDPRARGFVGSRLMRPWRSRLARWACTVDGDVQLEGGDLVPWAGNVGAHAFAG